MPSWQARLVNLSTRLLIRRRDWGDERALTRRARRLFGSPLVHRSLAMRGVRRERLREREVRGEWLTPAAQEPLPDPDRTILYFHGGGFVSCSTATHRPIAAALARLGGHRVLSIDYRLAPEHRFPAASDDVVAAYRWLLARGVPASTVAVAGDSAGGNLTLALLVRARDEGLPLPACAVAFSPWTDLTGSGESVRANDGRCAMFRPENMAQFASVYLHDRSPRDPAASPLYADLRGLPPTLLQVGSTELLLDDARRMHERLLAAGVVSTLSVFDDVMHCWQMLDGLVPEARAALQQATEFVARHVRSGVTRPAAS